MPLEYCLLGFHRWVESYTFGWTLEQDDRAAGAAKMQMQAMDDCNVKFCHRHRNPLSESFILMYLMDLCTPQRSILIEGARLQFFSPSKQ
jgi:hypothetical protein